MSSNTPQQGGSTPRVNGMEYPSLPNGVSQSAPVATSSFDNRQSQTFDSDFDFNNFNPQQLYNQSTWQQNVAQVQPSWPSQLQSQSQSQSQYLPNLAFGAAGAQQGTFGQQVQGNGGGQIFNLQSQYSQQQGQVEPGSTNAQFLRVLQSMAAHPNPQQNDFAFTQQGQYAHPGQPFPQDLFASQPQHSQQTFNQAVYPQTNSSYDMQLARARYVEQQRRQQEQQQADLFLSQQGLMLAANPFNQQLPTYTSPDRPTKRKSPEDDCLEVRRVRTDMQPSPPQASDHAHRPYGMAQRSDLKDRTTVGEWKYSFPHPPSKNQQMANPSPELITAPKVPTPREQPDLRKNLSCAPLTSKTAPPRNNQQHQHNAQSAASVPRYNMSQQHQQNAQSASPIPPHNTSQQHQQNAQSASPIPPHNKSQQQRPTPPPINPGPHIISPLLVVIDGVRYETNLPRPANILAMSIYEKGEPPHPDTHPSWINHSWHPEGCACCPNGVPSELIRQGAAFVPLPPLIMLDRDNMPENWLLDPDMCMAIFEPDKCPWDHPYRMKEGSRREGNGWADRQFFSGREDSEEAAEIQEVENGDVDENDEVIGNGEEVDNGEEIEKGEEGEEVEEVEEVEEGEDIDLEAELLAAMEADLAAN